MEAGRRLVGRNFGSCVAEAMTLVRSSERDKKWDRFTLSWTLPCLHLAAAAQGKQVL